MINEEMFSVIMQRMDTVGSGIENLTVRMDTLEDNINMEFWAVRAEMDSLSKLLRQDIGVLNTKVDRIMFSKDVEGYEKRRCVSKWWKEAILI